MTEKDKSGNYYLTFDGSNICSQCEKPIIHGDRIFTDATGTYLKNDNVIKIQDVNIYHYKCIISEP